MVINDKSLFLIGSPPCTAFSCLQELSRGKRDPGVAAAELRAAEVQLRFCGELYWLQLRGHRFFVHEHPSEATSWCYPEVVELACHREVGLVTVDMCCHGMVVDTGPLQGPARKRTKVLSNSQEVLKRVEAHCLNGLPDKSFHHVHVPLESGRAKRCQIHPRAFCRLIVEGIAAEKKLRALGLKAVPLMSVEEIESAGDEASGVLHEPDLDVAVDDKSGEALDPKLVRAARKDEMAYFRDMGVYDKVDLSERLAATG